MLSMQFVLGGKALFSVSNNKGQHFTYKVNHKDERWFVSLLTGPDNIQDYTYLGMLNGNGNFMLTKASKMKLDSLPVKVFVWAIKMMESQTSLPDGYKIQHEGRCCKCGRLLTHPESLDSGIGPECRKAA